MAYGGSWFYTLDTIAMVIYPTSCPLYGMINKLNIASSPSIDQLSRDSGIMEREAIKESVVRGHNVYKEAWQPDIGEILSVFSKPNNHHDRRAVAIYLWDGVVVG